eukprot:gene8408-17329_t
MPSLVKIRVERARDLPVMDRNLQGDEYTDSYVEIRLGESGEYQSRTQTCRKTLNPIWEEEFRFEIVDDSILQNTPVEFKIMDQDLYSSEQIGGVFVDLNPLIMRTANGSDNRDLVIQGWLPIYDTMRGVHGSLKIIIKLQFIGDDNPFRESSAGVQFFSSSSLSGNIFLIQEVLGIVADLVVEDDPEVSWQDYFRMAKTPNDSRMKVMYNLTASVRREIGKKVLEAGGNAVLGYHSHFDIEGTSGIVARAYGTACRIIRTSDIALPLTRVSSVRFSGDLQAYNAMDADNDTDGLETPPLVGLQNRMMMNTNNSNVIPVDAFLGGGGSGSGPNQGLGLGGGSMSMSAPLAPLGTQMSFVTDKSVSHILQREMSTTSSIYQHGLYRLNSNLGDFVNPSVGVGKDNAAMVFQSEVQICSLKTFDSDVRVRFGGLVIARSVKFLGKLESSLADQETREG